MHIINLEKYKTLDNLKADIQEALIKETFCLVIEDGELLCGILSPTRIKEFVKDRAIKKIKKHPTLALVDEVINRALEENIVDEDGGEDDKK